MNERLVIIGGGAAGMSAAAKARRLKQDLNIVVYEKSGYVSYGACGFPYYTKRTLKFQTFLSSGLSVRPHNQPDCRAPYQFHRQNSQRIRDRWS